MEEIKAQKCKLMRQALGSCPPLWYLGRRSLCTTVREGGCRWRPLLCHRAQPCDLQSEFMKISCWINVGLHQSLYLRNGDADTNLDYYFWSKMICWYGMGEVVWDGGFVFWIYSQTILGLPLTAK